MSDTPKRDKMAVRNLYKLFGDKPEEGMKLVCEGHDRHVLLMLQEERQRGIIFISHDLDKTMRIGKPITIMQDGIVTKVGTPDETLKDPANDYVRSFFCGVDVSKVLSARGHSCTGKV